MRKMNIIKILSKLMDFDQGRLQVAKGAVGAYLNFRFGTQKIMNNLLTVFAKYSKPAAEGFAKGAFQKELIIGRPLYNRLNIEIDSSPVALELTPMTTLFNPVVSSLKAVEIVINPAGFSF